MRSSFWITRGGWRNEKRAAQSCAEPITIRLRTDTFGTYNRENYAGFHSQSSLWRAHAGQESRVHAGHRTHACAGNWREHGNFYHREFAVAAAVSVSRSTAALKHCGHGKGA